MRKFDIEKHIRKLEFHSPNSDEAHRTMALDVEDLAMSEQRHILLALTVLNQIGIDCDQVESALAEIKFNPPKEYNCTDLEEINLFAWVNLGRMFERLEESELSKMVDADVFLSRQPLYSEQFMLRQHSF